MRVMFHHPLPLDERAKSASGIRPLRMLAAFESLGCDVELVTGYSADRAKAIARVKEQIRQGRKYDFVYSESSTMPTVLTDPHHLPVCPLMDWCFLRFCKSHDIPIGLFYRDIYWRFENYGTGLSPIKVAVAKAAYWYDLWVYQQALTKLYLPSIEMGKHVPYVKPDIFEALPPGHAVCEVTSTGLPDFSNRPLRLFYVGGMSSHYQMHKLFEAVKKLPRVELTVCTREAEWLAVRHEYPALAPNIKVVHLSGQEMEQALSRCDVALLFVKPQAYREFASPVKLYEYLGHQKPILASEGTLAGQYVKEQGVGWALSYEVGAVTGLFNSLLADPALFQSVHAQVQRHAPLHSWRARAEKVIKDLAP